MMISICEIKFIITNMICNTLYTINYKSRVCEFIITLSINSIVNVHL